MQSTAINKTQYSFNTMFADGVGTNPDELPGAAHAGCCTMAVSAVLFQQGFTAGNLDTQATVVLDVVTQTITNIRPELTAPLMHEVFPGRNLMR